MTGAPERSGPASDGASPRRFRRFAWGLVVYNLGVILWGAYVRATGSGAGCGNHWPLCNGEVLPRPESVETLIELTHRLTSALDGLLVLALAAWAFRAFPRRHPVRWAAAGSLVFLVSEALIGAGLVRFELVAGNTSIARAWVMAAHLLNTFLLLACLTLTAEWARPRVGREPGAGGTGRRRVLAASPSDPAAWLLGLGLVGVLLLGVSGAVAALGDTLFPAATFEEGLAQELAPGAHAFVRLRVFHPAIAFALALYLAAAAFAVARLRPAPAVERRAGWLVRLFVLQLAVGLANLWLAAPVAMQLLHLLLADLVWIALVLLTAAALTRSTVTSPHPRPEGA